MVVGQALGPGDLHGHPPGEHGHVLRAREREVQDAQPVEDLRGDPILAVRRAGVDDVADVDLGLHVGIPVPARVLDLEKRGQRVPECSPRTLSVAARAVHLFPLANGVGEAGIEDRP